MASRDRRLKLTDRRPKIRGIAEQTLGRASLTRRNVGDSQTNLHTAESKSDQFPCARPSRQFAAAHQSGAVEGEADSSRTASNRRDWTPLQAAYNLVKWLN